MNKLLMLSIVLLCLGMPSTVFTEQVGGGNITFSPKNTRPVVFSHELHVKGKGLKCMGCHYQIFEMAHGSYKMDMAKITKGDFCGKCHNGQKAFDVKEAKNCTRCHK